MKTEKFQLRGNNSVCAGAFQLLRGRAPAQLRGNIVLNVSIFAVLLARANPEAGRFSLVRNYKLFIPQLPSIGLFRGLLRYAQLNNFEDLFSSQK